MAFGTITSTSNTFGSVDGTATGVIPGTLSGSVGVPGPQGPAGAAGPQGEPGEGVPVGGTAGQVLAKVDGVDYNTEWVNVEGDYLPLAGGAMDANALITLSDGTNNSEVGGWGFGVQQTGTPATYATVEPTGVTATDGLFTTTVAAGGFGAIDASLGTGSYLTCQGITFPDNTSQTTAGRSLTDYDFTNVADTKLTTFGLTLTPVSTTTATYDSFINVVEVQQSYDASIGGTIAGEQKYAYHSVNGVACIAREWVDNEGTIEPQDLQGFVVNAQSGLRFYNWNTVASGTMQYGRTSITFPNASVQTIAFPGFNNAALTGNSTAVTAALGDNDTSIATTAFVQQELLSGTANARNLEVYVRNQTGSTIPAGSIVYINGATGNRPTITLAQANNDANSAQTIGFTKTAITNNGFGFVIVRGELENINTSALTEGVQLYLSPTTAGTWTTTKPSAPQHLVYVGVVIRSHPTLGTILVSVQNGYEVAELHDSAISGLADNDLFVYELSTDLWKNKSFATLGLAGLNSPAFTGTPSLPTGTTAVTQTAGNNTTALATTAFVTTSNPDASTTVKGHVELATNAEAVAGTSTTLAVTPNGLEAEIVSPTVSKYFTPAWGGATSGAGATAIAVFGNQRVEAPTSAIGSAIRSHVISQNFRGVNPDNAPANFSKRIAWGFRLLRYSFGTTDANSVCRVVLGKTGVVGDPTVKSIGISFTGTSVLRLMVHDGTTLRTVDTTFTPLHLQGCDCVIISDGAGNVSLSVNGTQVATSANGPVGTGSNSPVHNIEVENIAVLTGSRMGAYYSNHTISTEA